MYASLSATTIGRAGGSRPEERPDPRTTVGCAVAATGPSVPALRSFARTMAARWGLGREVDEALALVVSELAGNVVRHSGSADLVLTLRIGADTLTVEVRDHGQWREPQVKPPAPATLGCGGRGLQLVSAYATRCTVITTITGTRVIAELPLPW
ncbi:ATP-binding protein [Streptomyces tateyamensis]|uniref:ATP-binding protein n=1 Tax=Streptomyces tateyamensis TaxID=565073 RepID=A0A2V4NJ76_9ACTN|nr:ATP-binding protein [Streptomyces tateyamensis]PYC79528.1 ATP-binding protein [Streptomyces tateyamensis]